MYPAGLRFFSEFCDGLTGAIRQYSGDVEVIVVSDCVPTSEVEGCLSELAPSVGVVIAQAKERSFPLIRQQMLLAAAGRACEAVVSFDMDDVPNARSLTRHAEALEEADFSYGDMVIINEKSELAGGTFFDDAEVPKEVASPDVLFERNFIGFTNSAAKSDCVLDVAVRFPGEVDAADWWFFSRLLGAGYRGKQTSGPVVSYRTHGSSLLGAQSPGNPAEVRSQCEIILKHLETQKPGTGAAERKKRIEGLLLVIDEEPDLVQSLLDQMDGHGVWFEHAFRIAREISAT